MGEIIDDQIVLSDMGEIAKKFWLEIPNRFPNVILDEWVIMPNHVHGILVIRDECRNAPWRVHTSMQTMQAISNQQIISPPHIHPLMKGSISSVVNHFKGNVKRYCNKNNLEFFEWQSRFYDRIVRDERALKMIRRYIRENPVRWGRDRMRRMGRNP